MSPQVPTSQVLTHIVLLLGGSLYVPQEPRSAPAGKDLRDGLVQPSRCAGGKLRVLGGGRWRGAKVTRWQSQDPNLVSWQMEDKQSVGEKLHF